MDVDEMVEVHVSDVSLAAAINRMFQVHGQITHRQIWSALMAENERRRRDPASAAPIQLRRGMIETLDRKTQIVLGLE